MTVTVTFVKGDKVRLVFSNKLVKETLFLIGSAMNLIAYAHKGDTSIMLTDRVSFDKMVEDKVLLFK